MDESSIEEMFIDKPDPKVRSIIQDHAIERKAKLTKKVLKIFHEHGNDWFKATNALVDFIYDYAIACDVFYEEVNVEAKLLIEKILRSEDGKRSVMINMLIQSFYQRLEQTDMKMMEEDLNALLEN